jgi:hypothetical protein
MTINERGISPEMEIFHSLGKNMPEENLSPEKSVFLSVVEIILALLLFALSIALAVHAVSSYKAGNVFYGVKYTGFAILILSGCFDPVNYVWLCLPFTSKLVVKGRAGKIQMACLATGLFIVVANWLFAGFAAIGYYFFHRG